MAVCRTCGQGNPEVARFCLACGASLAAQPPTGRDVRKTVTVVFCDMAGSTALGEQLDPESLRRIMGRYFEAMRAVLERHGGTVEKFIGDAVMAVFGIPLSTRTTPCAPCGQPPRCASAHRPERELEPSAASGSRCAIGVNTGEVVTGDRRPVRRSRPATRSTSRRGSSRRPSRARS